jgi:hypothetical protein
MAAEDEIRLYYQEHHDDGPHECSVLRSFCSWAHRHPSHHPCLNRACTLNEQYRARPAPRAEARLEELDIEGAWKIVGKLRWEGMSDRTYELEAAKAAVASCNDRRLGGAIRLLASHYKKEHVALAELDEGTLVQLLAMGKAFASEVASSESFLEYAKNEVQDVDLLSLL